jgi:hypothetical protein
MSADATDSEGERKARTHLRIGWWGLLVFLSLGIALEVMHAMKAGFYLDPTQEVRRLMWRLAHTHGALLSLLNVAFALTLNRWRANNAKQRALASGCLAAATLIIPAGFFAGGAFVHGGDPGLGVFLVPPGALLLFVAVFVTARSVE